MIFLQIHYLELNYYNFSSLKMIPLLKFDILPKIIVSTYLLNNITLSYFTRYLLTIQTYTLKPDSQLRRALCRAWAW